ncbi:PAS domain-containing protein [Polaromonas sp.]|uniref:ATP-binding response regulator n=1 Tax=Polaromonas sp. TaxID=1869339 RepID=UPI003C9EDAAA
MPETPVAAPDPKENPEKLIQGFLRFPAMERPDTSTGKQNPSHEKLQAINEELRLANFELKARVEEAAKTNDDLQNFIAASDIATVFVDTAMRIKRYTPQAVHIFNLSPSDINRPLLDIQDRLNDESLAQDAEKVFQTRQTIERAVESADGCHYLARIRPYRTTDDRIDGAVLTFVDVTALRRAEEAVREAMLQREKANSSQARATNELKDRFLAVMSHELKHPLNLIQVNTELLINQPEVRALPPVLRAGENIRLAVASQVKIIDDLLDLSRVRTGKLTFRITGVALDELLATIVEAAAENARRKGLDLSFEKPAGTIVQCDRVRTEQICWNLINNAIKFTPQGGQVKVRLTREDGFARLGVVDTGQGISADFLPHVFGMFSQGQGNQAQTGGLGVGLALVQELATAQGGRVLAESPGRGRGAAFSVWLPLESREARNAREDQPPGTTAGSLRGLRILAVDDMLEALEPFADLLRLDGAVVDTAGTGEQALEALESSSCDLLISDLGMTDMDGFALIEEIRKRPSLQRIPALALSGYGRQADVQRALQLGFDGHLSKPVTLARLRQAVAALKSTPAS